MNSDRVILGFLISGILIVYTAIVFAFFGSEGETRFIFLFLMGAPLVLAFVITPKTGVIVLCILVYSIDWISESWRFIPREATWLIDMLLVMFIARIAVTYPWRKIESSKIEKWIIIAVLFSVVSALVNGVSQVTYLVGLRLAFKYMLLFVAIYHLDLSRRWFNGYVKLLFGIILIQPAVVILQWKFTYWDSPDDLYGTFGLGQTGNIALFIMILMSYYVAQIIEKRHFKSYMLAAIAWLSIAPFLGEAKTFFLVFPIAVIFMIRAEFFKRPAIAISISIIGLISMISFDYAIKQSGYWLEGRNPLTYFTRLGEVYQKETTAEDTSVPVRFFQLATSTKMAASSPKDFLAGNGPGSITHSLVAGSHSRVKEYFDQWRLTSNAPSIAWLLIEYGYLGTIIMLVPVYLIYRRGKVLRRSDDIQLRIYGRWLEGIVVLYGIWLFYTSTMQLDSSSYIFWSTTAILVRFSYVEEERLKMKETLERAEEARRTISIPKEKPLIAS